MTKVFHMYLTDYININFWCTIHKSGRNGLFY